MEQSNKRVKVEEDELETMLATEYDRHEWNKLAGSFPEHEHLKRACDACNAVAFAALYNEERKEDRELLIENASRLITKMMDVGFEKMYERNYTLFFFWKHKVARKDIVRYNGRGFVLWAQLSDLLPERYIWYFDRNGTVESEVEESEVEEEEEEEEEEKE